METENNEPGLFDIDFDEKAASESSDEELDIPTQPKTEPENTDLFGLERNWVTNQEEDEDVDLLQLRNNSNKEQVISNKNLGPPLVIREYQRKLFDACKDQNSIIFLDTGSGKTLITIMILYYRLAKCMKKKKVVFLANTLNLVEQQSEQIRNYLPRIAQLKDIFSEHLDAEVLTLHGQRREEFWSLFRPNPDHLNPGGKNPQKEEKKDTDIYAMTAQSFLNSLRRGYLKLSDIDTLIFDECHHAHDNHPYNSIMNEFYFRLKFTDPTAPRPLIIGTTASPILVSRTISVKKIQIAVKEIIQNLDAKIFTSDGGADFKHAKTKFPLYNPLLISSHGGTANIEELVVLAHKRSTQDVLREIQSDKLAYFKEFAEHMEILLESAAIRKGISEELLALIGELHKIIFYHCLTLIAEMGEYPLYLLFEDIRLILQTKKNTAKKLLKDDEEVLTRLVDSFDVFLQNNKQLKNENLISSKLKELIDIIKKFQSYQSPQGEKQQHSILIFTAKRFLAERMSQFLNSQTATTGMQLSCDFIIGQRDKVRKEGEPKFKKRIFKAPEDLNESEVFMDQSFLNPPTKEQGKEKTEVSVDDVFDPTMAVSKPKGGPPKKIAVQDKLLGKKVTYQDQVLKLKAFREKTINILISTSVSEEGIDIPDCDLVISFNPPENLRSYVQLRGRARKENATYMIFVTPEKKKDYEEKINLFNVTMKAVKTAVNQYLEESKKMEESGKSEQNSEAFKTQLAKLDRNSGFEELVIPETGARLNTNWSIELLALYCSSYKKYSEAITQPKYITHI